MCVLLWLRPPPIAGMCVLECLPRMTVPLWRPSAYLQAHSRAYGPPDMNSFSSTHQRCQLDFQSRCNRLISYKRWFHVRFAPHPHWALPAWRGQLTSLDCISLPLMRQSICSEQWTMNRPPRKTPVQVFTSDGFSGALSTFLMLFRCRLLALQVFSSRYRFLFFVIIFTLWYLLMNRHS